MKTKLLPSCRCQYRTAKAFPRATRGKTLQKEKPENYELGGD
jgi:hypothetical protein